MEKIIEFRTKGAILRPKIKWFNEGEKNTKYFLRLEKRHYKQGTITQLKINKNDFITSDQKILSECKLFYTNLYTSKFNTHHSLHNMSDVFFKHENDTVLNEEEQKSCEGLLTERARLKALKTMEAGKTPGTNGLPAESYRVFWTDISIYETGQLSIRQKRGVIKLKPRKDAEPYHIKN